MKFSGDNKNKFIDPNKPIGYKPVDIQNELEQAIDFQTKWNNSSRSKRMLKESFKKGYEKQTGIGGIIGGVLDGLTGLGGIAQNFAASAQAKLTQNQRNFNMKDTTIVQAESHEDKLADYNENKKEITLYGEEGSNSITHEVGHSINENDQSRMPSSDVNLIYDTMQNAKSQEESGIDPFYYPEVKKIYGQNNHASTEHVRIKMMEDRKYLFEKGFDVMNKPIGEKEMEVLKNRNREKDKGYGKYVPQILGKKNYMKLLNTVAENTEKSNNNYT